jgi:membrane protease YdiL (CAAX protease family)
MVLWDHVIFLLVTVAVPLNQYLGRHQLRAMLDYHTAQRINAYWNMIIVQWIMLALLLSFWLWQARPLAQLGIVMTFGLRFWVSVGVAMLSIIGLGLYYRSQLRDRKKLMNLRELADQLVPFLPRNKHALKHFNLLCLTAGIVEEFIYRGFFIWYASRFLGNTMTGLILSVIITSALFTLSHLYQGRRGMGMVFVVGLLHGGIYILSGSLWVPMAMHAIMDLSGGRMALKLHPEGEIEPREESSESSGRKAA